MADCPDFLSCSDQTKRPFRWDASGTALWNSFSFLRVGVCICICASLCSRLVPQHTWNQSEYSCSSYVRGYDQPRQPRPPCCNSSPDRQTCVPPERPLTRHLIWAKALTLKVDLLHDVLGLDALLLVEDEDLSLVVLCPAVLVHPGLHLRVCTAQKHVQWLCNCQSPVTFDWT